MVSAGPHYPAWDLRPIIWATLGVYIILVALATCMIKRRKKDDSNGGATYRTGSVSGRRLPVNTGRTSRHMLITGSSHTGRPMSRARSRADHPGKSLHETLAPHLLG